MQYVRHKVSNHYRQGNRVLVRFSASVATWRLFAVPALLSSVTLAKRLMPPDEPGFVNEYRST